MSRLQGCNSEWREGLDGGPVASARSAARHTGSLRYGLALVALLLSTASSPAQTRRIVEVPRHGVEVFANLLHEQGLKPLQGAKDLTAADPEKTLIVLFGRLDGLEDIDKAINRSRGQFLIDAWGRPIPSALSHFLNSGGALLIASDYPDRGRLASLGVGISGLPVHQDQESSFLGSFPSCPVLGVGPPFNAPHPVMRDLKKPLATMRPSIFSAQAHFWRPVARYPNRTYVAGRFRAPDPAEKPWMLASPQWTPGRALIIAGHGVFMNGVLVRQEHDNFLFARNVVRHLSEGPKGPRSHVLFLEQGETVPKLNLSLDSPPLPLGFLINTVIDQLQRQGQPEEFLRKNVMPQAMWLWLLLGITGLALPLACRRLLLARFRRDTSAALVVGLHEKPPPPLPLSRQRQGEMLARRNFAEPARVLARQWLRDCGLAETASLPAYEHRASWWRRRRLTKSLRRVGQLAGDEPLGMVSTRQLRQLQILLAELTQAFRSGEIRFVSPGSAPKKE